MVETHIFFNLFEAALIDCFGLLGAVKQAENTTVVMTNVLGKSCQFTNPAEM